MAKVDYEKVLQAIQAVIRESEEESDYARAGEYRKKAEALSAWLNGGRQGDCPVDLTEFGGEVIAAPVPRQEETTVSIPSKEGPDTVQAPPVSLQAEGQAALEVKEASPQSSPLSLQEYQPATAPEETGEEVALTPEERQIQKALKEVREHIEAGRWRQAVALASAVAGRASGAAKELAEQFLEEARQKRDHAVSLAIKKGDEAFHQGDQEQARRHYEEALGFDPENEHAKSMLRNMEDTAAGKLSAQKVAELRGGLRDLKNIKRLGAAVYEAEALDAEGRLPEDLQTLLREARENYNNIRIAQGEETTMMRFGDLAARKEARDKIAARLAQGEKYIFDPTTNEERPTFDALKEADRLLEEHSADTAQYEMDVINGLLPFHPVGARARLEMALTKPFHDHHRRLLERKLEEINTLLEKQKSAEAYLAQAAEEERSDPVKAYATVLVAHNAFPYLPGIDVRLAQARNVAESYVVRKAEEAFTQARLMVGFEAPEESRRLIDEAMRLIDRWPLGQDIPETLKAFKAQGQILLEFDTRANFIRKEVKDSNRVGMALSKLEEMRKDERFATLPAMRALIAEMDQYRDTGDQLREAHEERLKGNWKRVFELTTKIRESKRAGNLAAEVEALHAEAEREVRIEDARGFLDNLEIKKANAIISQLIITAKGPDRQQLEERLKSEREIIAAAIKNTPIMEPIFDRAVALRGGGEEERLQALRLFRFVGNMGEKPSPDLPDFVVTLRTADARRAAIELSHNLTNHCWPPIEQAFKNEQREKIRRDELERLVRCARILREANLVDSATKRAALRWVEVAWGTVVAQSKETKQDWEGAREVWSQLNELYPEDEEIAQRLEEAQRRVHMAQIILRAADPERPREALLFIRNALKDAAYKPFYAMLTQHRDQIFQQAQEEFLRRSREALASRSATGKINAFISLVDLGEIEEIVGISESRRRSARELTQLNPHDFKNAAEAILQRSNVFSFSQQSVEESIRITKEIISRLEMFVKVAPLFDSHWSELAERLERRRSELLSLNQKLEEADRLLGESRDPALWNDALKRGSFDALRMKREAIVAQGPNFTSMPDVRELDQKLREWQEAYDLLKERASEIKKAFDVEEDFKKVLDISRRLASPLMDWQTITPSVYEQILAQVDFSLFRVANVYGNPLVGRVDIETAAQQCEAQYERWLAWYNLWKQKMEDAEQARQVVNQHIGFGDKLTAFQLRDWKNFEQKAQSAKDILQNTPEEKENILSQKVSVMYEASQAALVEVENWLHRCAIEIEKLDAAPKFPTAAEFSEAANKNDLPGLERLLARAERVGALTEDEEKRLKWYRKVYETKIQESKKKPLWKLR